MNKLLIILTAIFVSAFFIKSAQAKVLPQSSKAAKTISKSAGTTIGVFPKLRADKRALVVNFSNLNNAKAVSYMLVYKTNGQEEAAMGALNLTGQNSVSNELLFGTCSRNVCRYHSNITDARLEVSYTSSANKKYLKKYKIKV